MSSKALNGAPQHLSLQKIFRLRSKKGTYQSVERDTIPAKDQTVLCAWHFNRNFHLKKANSLSVSAFFIRHHQSLPSHSLWPFLEGDLLHLSFWQLSLSLHWRHPPADRTNPCRLPLM